MENPISSQLYHALTAFLTGGVLGIVYDVFRAMRRRCGLTVLFDLLFWLFSAAVLFTLGLGPGPGGVRLFMLIGAGFGAGLYFFILSPVVLQGLKLFFGILARIFALPLRWLKKRCKKIKYFLKNSFQKAKKWFTITCSKLGVKEALGRKPVSCEESANEAKKNRIYYENRYSGSGGLRMHQPGGGKVPGRGNK